MPRYVMYPLNRGPLDKGQQFEFTLGHDQRLVTVLSLEPYIAHAVVEVGIKQSESSGIKEGSYGRVERRQEPRTTEE
jgi:hypothetical protein